MEDKELIEKLNTALSQEYACAIRYGTHAAVVEGPYADVVQARLKEIVADEMRHAEMLRDRIVALGGEPEMNVRTQDLISAKTLEEIIRVNIQEETEAIQNYEAIFKEVPIGNAILFQAIQDIIKEEQEHLEELEKLKVRVPRQAA